MRKDLIFMKRTPLAQRALPQYTPAQERLNALTHGVGILLALFALALLLRAALPQGPLALGCALAYGGSMTLLYTMSTLYHGWRPGTAKKVLQVLDHCVIYGLIAGTYTPIALLALGSRYPALGWGVFTAQWLLALTAATLTAIDLRRFRILSMVCYIGCGWMVLGFLPQTLEVLTPRGFGLLLAGGLSYTLGAALFGLGKRRRWLHTVFHLLVLLGTLFQLQATLGYVF